MSIKYHCDPEVSFDFIALSILRFDMILRQGEELETGVSFVLISSEFDPEREELTEQTLFTI